MADTFSWNGLQFEYFDHPYNHTARNMRRVEIPIPGRAGPTALFRAETDEPAAAGQDNFELGRGQRGDSQQLIRRLFGEFDVTAILNLGAGNRIIGDAVNHDLTKHRPEIAVAWDLNKLPWPWPDNSFDQIVARAVLEHLRLNLVESLDECWRILRPGGQIFLKLPHWQSEIAHQDPTHYWFFSLGSFDQFDPDMPRGKVYSFYTTRKWKILEPVVLNKAQSSIIAKMQVRK